MLDRTCDQSATWDGEEARDEGSETVLRGLRTAAPNSLTILILMTGPPITWTTATISSHSSPTSSQQLHHTHHLWSSLQSAIAGAFNTILRTTP